MKINFITSILLLLTALMLDLVAGPFILGKWVGLHFTAATVVIIGLRRGRWAGIAAGVGSGNYHGILLNGPIWSLHA